MDLFLSHESACSHLFWRTQLAPLLSTGLFALSCTSLARWAQRPTATLFLGVEPGYVLDNLLTRQHPGVAEIWLPRRVSSTECYRSPNALVKSDAVGVSLDKAGTLAA